MSGAEFEGYEALVSELRASPPVAPESLRQRVLEGAPASRAPRSRKRRFALVVVPVAVVLAVGAAVVHGFVNSGSHPEALQAARVLHGAVTTTPSKEAVPQAERKAAKAAPANGTPVFGYHLTQNQTKEKDYSGFYAAGADALGSLKTGQNAAVSIPTNRLVHATASLEVQVTGSELSKKTNQASQIVGALGGYAQSVHYEASHHGGGNAILALRVPVQKAQIAIAHLGNLGKLLSQQVSTQDLQAKLTGQTNAIGSLRRAIAVYESALQSTTLPASQRAILEIKLNNARHALARLRHARTGTVASGATADISLLLTTQNHAVVGPQHHGSTRIGRLLGSAAHFLALEGIVVLYALIVLAPFLLIGGLVWWFLRERRRREERLLSTA
jgi:Domain of unknown function (DUF4349)